LAPSSLLLVLIAALSSCVPSALLNRLCPSNLLATRSSRVRDAWISGRAILHYLLSPLARARDAIPRHHMRVRFLRRRHSRCVRQLRNFRGSQPGDSSAADLFDGGGDACDVAWLIGRQGAVPFLRVALLDSPRWPGGSDRIASRPDLLGTQAPIAQPGGSPVDRDLPGPSMATSEATRSSGLTDHRHGPSGLNDTPANRIRRMRPPRMPQDASGWCLVTRNTTPESDALAG
jgi:hypothetical protein